MIFNDYELERLRLSGGTCTRREDCSRCDGSGVESWTDKYYAANESKCSRCEGKGYRYYKYTAIPCKECGTYHIQQMDPRPTHKLTGEKIIYEQQYLTCPGTTIREEEDHNPCFLTTACVEIIGFPDDCNELFILRKFRDEILLNSEKWMCLVDEYSIVAPRISNELRSHPERISIALRMFVDIKDICVKINNPRYEEAIFSYKKMVQMTESYLRCIKK